MYEALIQSLQTQICLGDQIHSQLDIELKAREDLVKALSEKLENIIKDRDRWRRFNQEKILELERTSRRLKEQQEREETSILGREMEAHAGELLKRQISRLESEKEQVQANADEEIARLSETLRERSDELKRTQDTLDNERTGNVSMDLESRQTRHEETQRHRAFEITWDEERAKLNDQADAFRKDIDDVNIDLNDARQALSHREHEYEVLKAELEAQWRSTETTTEKMDALKKEKRELLEENETLARAKRAFAADTERLSQEKEALAAEKETLANERETLRAEMETLRENLAATSSTYSQSAQETAAQVSALQTRMSGLEQHGAEMEREVQESRQRYAEKEERVLELETQNIELETEVQEILAQKDTIATERDEAEEQLQTVQTEVDELTQALRDRDLQVITTNNSVQERNDTISRFEHELRELEIRHETVVAERQFATDATARLETNLKQRDSDVAGFTAHLASKNSELEELRDELSNIKRGQSRSAEEQSRALQEALNGQTSARVELDNAVRERAEIQAEQGIIKDQIVALKAEVDRQRRQIHELQQDSADKEMRLTTAQKQRTKDKDDIEGLNIALDSKQQELELLKRRFSVKGTAGTTPAQGSKPPISHRRTSSAFTTPSAAPRSSSVQSTSAIRPPSALSSSSRASSVMSDTGDEKTPKVRPGAATIRQKRASVAGTPTASSQARMPSSFARSTSTAARASFGSSVSSKPPMRRVSSVSSAAETPKSFTRAATTSPEPKKRERVAVPA